MSYFTVVADGNNNKQSDKNNAPQSQVDYIFLILILSIL